MMDMTFQSKNKDFAVWNAPKGMPTKAGIQSGIHAGREALLLELDGFLNNKANEWNSAVPPDER